MTAASTAIAYCGSAPAPGEVLLRWNLDPVLLAALALCVVAVARRAGEGRMQLVAALGIAALLFVSPLCAATSALFSARVVHHLLLVAVVAPLVASAIRRPPVLGAGTALALHVVTLWSWHVPNLYGWALASAGGYWSMQATLFVPALLFWHAVLRGRGVAGPLALVAAVAQMGLLGAVLTFAPTALYRQHWLTTGAWGLSPIEDQQLAGLLMWVPAILPYALAAAWLVRRSLAGGGTSAPAPVPAA